MNKFTSNNPRVLAIAPCVQGIGYIVFNDPRSPIDWGIKWTRHEKNTKGLEKIASLIDHYQPDVLIFEDVYGGGSRRADRIKDLLDNVGVLAQRKDVPVVSYARDRMRQTFRTDGTVTKYQIAKTIAEQLPELAPRLPVERKIWLPEHANMSIFDAVSLALTYFMDRSARDIDLAA